MESAKPPKKRGRRLAVIDCGSNTFSLQIVDALAGRWEEQFFMRHAVFLGRGGFKQACIMPSRFAKGIDALRIMKQATLNYAVDEVKVIATSVLRDASNGQDFCDKVRELTEWDVQIISGDQEAEWIHRGVAMTTVGLPDRHLIMDIGGGSLEFIVAESVSPKGQSEALWKQSFDAGVARLEDFGKPMDPLGEAGVERYQPFLDFTLAPLHQALKKYNPCALVGASGSFDTFLDLVNGGRKSEAASRVNEGHPSVEVIDREVLQDVHRELIISDLQKRLLMPGMSPPRAHMIPLASLLIQKVLSWMPENTILMHSGYALRQGVLDEMLDRKQ
jgi:exopolyphosphatase/guanosine-5'-triphosphate,3'-diphosphate pyrophosphatase